MADEKFGVCVDEDGNAPVLTLGCEHYKRKCKLVSPCCKSNYVCRFCHDEKEGHPLERHLITKVECMKCKRQQDISQTCANPECDTVFGKYYCEKCKLFDDEDKGQYHCDGCELCRVGYRENFFHCDTCELCLPKSIQSSHKCIVKMSKSNCPVCLEDIHTSRIVSHVPPCGHLVHRPCFRDLIKAGFYACPTCGKSMTKMSELWKALDEEIAETPMPTAYADLFCYVLCRDCHKECMTQFHVLGHKCLECGSYNTVRGKGGLYRRQVSAGQKDSDTDEAAGGPSGAEGYAED